MQSMVILVIALVAATFSEGHATLPGACLNNDKIFNIEVFGLQLWKMHYKLTSNYSIVWASIKPWILGRCLRDSWAAVKNKQNCNYKKATRTTYWL